MEQSGKREIPLWKVIQLYKEEGLEITAEQAASILEFLKRMAKIAVGQVLRRKG
ncbi:hypothetical protein SAMN05216327_108309 [Dyadobacter sp. SG02]|nr:hypothetical protein SAMN05216327_108309 [Dyadobacter sp. SG02]